MQSALARIRHMVVNSLNFQWFLHLFYFLCNTRNALPLLQNLVSTGLLQN